MLTFSSNRIPKFKAIFGKGGLSRYESYKKIAKDLQKKYHIPWFYFFVDIFVCRFIYGADVKDDYLYFKFYSLKWYERRRYVTYGKFVKQTKWFFTDKANLYVDSKRAFLEHYKAFTKRDFLSLPLEYDENVRTFLENNPIVFVKDDFSNCAQGVHRYKAKELLSDKDLLAKVLKTNGVVEAGVNQCKEMAELNPDSVNTLRVTTMIEKSGDVRFFSAALRIGAKGAVVDNQHAGGSAFHVDVETGIVLSAGVDINGNKVIYSPTGKIIPGFKIPEWDRVKQDVIKAAEICKEARFVGWDIAIGNEGPIFIEANNSCSETLYQFDEGQWDYFLKQK